MYVSLLLFPFSQHHGGNTSWVTGEGVASPQQMLREAARRGRSQRAAAEEAAATEEAGVDVAEAEYNAALKHKPAIAPGKKTVAPPTAPPPAAQQPVVSA